MIDYGIRRVIVWFSCGAASAVAAKLAIEKHGRSFVEIIYCDTSKDEHPDNLRFLRDVENWLDVKVKFLKSDKYEGVDDVINKTQYIVGPRYAPCTKLLKTRLREDYQRPEDVHVFGYTGEEKNRMIAFENKNSHLDVDWILEDLTKDDCHEIIEKAGIKPNQMYLDGFPNANCIGCVKAANFSYWGLVKEKYPEVYKKRAKQERMVGATINKCQKNGKRTPIYLDEMTDEHFKRGRSLESYHFSCGALCDISNEEGVE